MRFDQLTIKAQEALQEAQRDARARGNAELTGDHLLLAMLKQADGVVVPILQKLGADPQALGREIESELDSRPRVSGASADPVLARDLNAVFDRAFEIAKEFGDEYVSTEHFLMALAEAGGDGASRRLSKAGVKKDALLKALKEVRGSARITDPNPEDKYQALKRYTRARIVQQLNSLIAHLRSPKICIIFVEKKKIVEPIDTYLFDAARRLGHAFHTERSHTANAQHFAHARSVSPIDQRNLDFFCVQANATDRWSHRDRAREVDARSGRGVGTAPRDEREDESAGCGRNRAEVHGAHTGAPSLRCKARDGAGRRSRRRSPVWRTARRRRASSPGSSAAGRTT